MVTTYQYLDIDHALSQIGDLDALRDMLPMLLEFLERDIPLIEGHFAANEISNGNALLHSLKGCMPIFCKHDICEELTALEHDTKVPTCDNAVPRYAALMPKLQKLQAEVAHYLAQG